MPQFISGDLDDIHVPGSETSGQHNVSDRGFLVPCTVVTPVRYHVDIVCVYHVGSRGMRVTIVRLGGVVGLWGCGVVGLWCCEVVGL